MKLYISYFLFVFCFSHSTFADAQDSSILKIMSQSELKASQLKNPVVATFWGAFKRFKDFTHNDGDVIKLKTSLFRSGNIDIYLSQKKERSPLYVFMPGIFGGLKRGLTPQMIDRLESLNGHVLVVPNFLSPEYMHSHPLYGGDPIHLEVQVMEEALSYALSQLGPRVSQIEVIAESLGTAIGAAWVAWDFDHLKRLTSLTMLWPPLNLAHAMKNFDQLILTHHKFVNNCSIIDKTWVFLREFAFKEFPESLQADEEKCLGVMVLIDGFLKNSKRSWKIFADENGLVEIEPESFEEFFKTYRGELWRVLTKKQFVVQLPYWMKLIRQNKQFPIRIMTSQNDFLNQGLSWSDFKNEFHLTDSELLIFPWGGHSGPIGLEDFTEILRFTLPPRK